jgi:hypothetical protein
MIHLYECIIDSSDDQEYRYWEVWEDHPYEAWQDEFITEVDHDELEKTLDNYRADGLDFVLHELGGIDEYHVALPSV